MPIQLLLTAALLGYGAYALFLRNVSRAVSSLATLACAGGILLVWNPGLANDLARLSGVGRGADLIFYVFIAVSGFVGLHLHLRTDRSMQMITELARTMAMRQPLMPRDIPDGSVDHGSRAVLHEPAGLPSGH
ncbi:MAG TPA: DUF2304 domain-containing protein [Acetobacteraceae bacterium]|nr:DUF2304 domain-containing protein [Acetobacteraceae bacterium]